MMVTGTVVGRAQAVAAPGRDPAWLLKLELEFRSRRAPPAGSPAGPLAGSDSESRHNTSAESESAGPPARPRRPGPTVTVSSSSWRPLQPGPTRTPTANLKLSLIRDGHGCNGCAMSRRHGVRLSEWLRERNIIMSDPRSSLESEHAPTVS